MTVMQDRAQAALVDLGKDEKASYEVRLNALQTVVKSTPTFFEVSGTDLAFFFLKCTLALVPAVILSFSLYVAGMLLSSAFIQLGG